MPNFTLPATAGADMFAYVGTLITGFWPVIAVVIGLPIAFMVVRFLVGLVRARAK